MKGLFSSEKSVSHLTLARVRSQNYREEIRKFLEKYKPVIIGSMRVDSIKLKKSTVTSKGPVYEDLAEFTLQAE
jgi:2'-5' RNA ligase